MSLRSFNKNGFMITLSNLIGSGTESPEQRNQQPGNYFELHNKQTGVSAPKYNKDSLEAITNQGMILPLINTKPHKITNQLK